ncbi:MAG: YciI family protein [Acidimicrobiales bacterium]
MSELNRCRGRAHPAHPNYPSTSEEMGVRGVLLGSERLRPRTTATTVRVRDGDVVIADGPFAETMEQIAGSLVDCRELNDATEVACRIPAAQYGTIEVRPVWEM